MAWTRRGIVRLFGAAGGFGAATAAMGALDMKAVAAAGAGRLDLGRIGGGRKVLILGAGVSGLSAAYELERAGFSCQVLEARTRAGGRNWTWRDGTKVPHRDGEQTVRFDEGDYFNAGPARIPGFHETVLGYCRDLGVPLEPFFYENKNAFFLSDKIAGGERVRHRRVRYSVQSAIEELMMKSLDRRALDAPVSDEDFEKLKEFFRLTTGRGDAPFPSELRLGFTHHPGAGLDAGELDTRIPISEIAQSDVLSIVLSTYDFHEWQATLMQPVGGMDQIPKAFLRNITSPVAFGFEARSMTQTDDKVVVGGVDRASGEARTFEGDFVICTLPLPIVDKMETAFSPKVAKAVAAAAEYWEPTSKMAWRAQRRFWEEDDGVYGGASSVEGPMMQYWYPNQGFGGAGGVLLGAYTAVEAAEFWTRLPLAEQIAMSRRFGTRLHPAFANEAIDPVGVDWLDQTYSAGGWAWLADDLSEGGPYQTLMKFDGRIGFAGDYLSHLPGWQEGALLSARHAMNALAGLVQSDL
ncbi:MAG: FAD-dependent oxidoreductase [Pseudomonadota bacterium]